MPAVCWLVLVLGLSAGTSGATDTQASEDPLARRILEKADEIRFPAESFQVDIYITSSAPERDTEKRKYRVLSKGNENTVVMILEPASERGQIMLMKGRDLWIFMPDVSQPIRLGLAQRLTGQVANGDLARANFSGDYNPKVLRTEKVDGEDHYVLELLAVDRGVTYHRVLLWVNKSNYRPYKAEFYSLSNRLMKTCSYENFREMAGNGAGRRAWSWRMPSSQGIDPYSNTITCDCANCRTRSFPRTISRSSSSAYNVDAHRSEDSLSS